MPAFSSVTDSNFEEEVLKSSLPVLVVFGATWCGPYKQLLPIIDRIAQDYTSQVKVVTCDIDDNPVTAQKNGVRSVPTSMVFKGGQKTSTFAGLTSRDRLIQLVGL